MSNNRLQQDQSTRAALEEAERRKREKEEQERRDRLNAEYYEEERKRQEQERKIKMQQDKIREKRTNIYLIVAYSVLAIDVIALIFNSRGSNAGLWVNRIFSIAVVGIIVFTKIKLKNDFDAKFYELFFTYCVFAAVFLILILVVGNLFR